MPDVLYIQPRTLEHHINSIFSKLGISSEIGQHTRVQAVLAFLKATGQMPQEVLAWLMALYGVTRITCDAQAAQSLITERYGGFVVSPVPSV